MRSIIRATAFMAILFIVNDRTSGFQENSVRFKRSVEKLKHIFNIFDKGGKFQGGYNPNYGSGYAGSNANANAQANSQAGQFGPFDYVYGIEEYSNAQAVAGSSANSGGGGGSASASAASYSGGASYGQSG
ncbi:unnamed protein product [Allacma fusca]|uniref:Uncharacterized protein n=1 Tax=Allacma fusca TaxID=39272 RepID=A0A8J2JTZ8_9HEXA|nr:unnamed protein product [Allacma fusca]